MAHQNEIEYKIVSGKPKEVEPQINDLAASGWVVDHVASAPGGGGTFAIFGLHAGVTIVMRRDRKST